MQIRSTPIRSASRRRSGLTLLELLITLGLGVLLIGSIGAAMTIYLNTETAGRARMERAQIVRALYLKMTNDIRAVVYREPLDAESSGSGVSAAEEAAMDELGQTSQKESIDPDTGLTQETVGLFGDSQKLVIHINRPRRLPVATGANSKVSTSVGVTSADYEGSGLRSISWYIADDDQRSASSIVVGATNSSGEQITGGGLARLDQDQLQLQSDVAARGSVDATSDAAVLAPEVESVQFRYFDGVDWLDSWDSSTQERLPNAVEVTLQFRSIAETETESDILTGGLASELDDKPFRFVIAIPLAPPPMTELQL